MAFGPQAVISGFAVRPTCLRVEYFFALCGTSFLCGLPFGVLVISFSRLARLLSELDTTRRSVMPLIMIMLHLFTFLSTFVHAGSGGETDVKEVRSMRHKVRRHTAAQLEVKAFGSESRRYCRYFAAKPVIADHLSHCTQSLLRMGRWFLRPLIVAHSILLNLYRPACAAAVRWMTT